MEVGDKMRIFGVQKFRTLSHFAVAMEMSLQSLSPYINGKVKPGSDVFKKLRKLGCDMNWLTSEDDSEMPDPEKNGSVIETAIKQMDEVQLSLIKAAINSGNDEAIKAATRMILIKIEGVEIQRKREELAKMPLSKVADKNETYKGE